MGRTAIDLQVSQGAAVLGLLERANVPPLPTFYALLYDYVAGVKGLQAGRVGGILTDGEGAVGDRLYAEFIAPYETKGTFERALHQMVARLATLDELIVESARATAEHSASLRDASAKFSGGHLDAGLLRDWIGTLERNNQRLHRASDALAEQLHDAQMELDETRAEISHSRENMRRDPLTGIANRGGLDDILGKLVAARGPAEPLSCAVIDIDHFKSLNDSYGHQVGDEVLRLVTRALLASARGSDIVGRPGGDEFVVVFPGTGLSAAHNVADGIRATIAASDLRTALGPDVLGGITVSVGVAEFQSDDTVARFFERADRCLYRAKQSGRNRVDSFDAIAA